MADPVGIAGTAVGIVSLCLQVYGSLSNYLNDLKDRDSYVTRVVSYLDRLQTLVRILESAIPSFQNDHPTLSQTVVLCLQDCEAQLKALHINIQKYQPTPLAPDLKGKLKETKRRFQFPFGRAELEKLADQLDRINQLLVIAIQGLSLQIQSDAKNQLVELKSSDQVTTSKLAAIHDEVKEINSKKNDLGINVKENRTAIKSLSQDIGGLSLISNEIHSSTVQINQIQANTTSSLTLLHELTTSQHQHTSKLEEIMTELKDSIIQANQTSPTEKLFQMLMSKPEFLRGCRDEFAAISPEPTATTCGPSPSGLQKRRGRVTSSCECYRRRQITRQFSQWRSIIRFDEAIIDLYHEPWCVNYKSSQAKKQRTTRIIYTGLHRLLNVAVEASLMYNTGAGGASIAPVLRYYAVVDEYNSPAFLIILAMEDSLSQISLYEKWEFGKSPETESMSQMIIRNGISRLQSIFNSKSSSPADVTNEGDTLIGWFLEHFFEVNAPTIIHNVLLELLSLGVPCVGNDWDLNSSLIRCFLDIARWHDDNEYVENELGPFLIKNLPENHTSHLYWDHLSNAAVRRCIFNIEGMTEVLGLDNPLCDALFQKSELRLTRALQMLPASSDLFLPHNISVVQIAMFWPKGLRILFNHYRKNDWENVYSDPILWLAMNISQQTCHEKGDILCENCPCAESLEILLELGIPLHNDIAVNLKETSQRAAYILLNHIKLWREKLRMLAERELLINERRELGLCDSRVLDLAASKVIHKLKSKGIFAYREFSLKESDYRLSPSTYMDKYSGPTPTIYYQTHSKYSAQIAFELGFRDIDAVFNGETPIMRAMDSSFERGQDLCEWYINHGASITRLVPFDPAQYREGNSRCPEFPSRYTVSHFLMEQASRQLQRRYNGLPSFKTSLISRIATLQIGDGCYCGCSDPDEGCVPLKILLAGSLRVGVGLDDYFGLESVLKGVDQYPFIVKAILRLLTFDALGLRHTCCETIARCRFPRAEDFKSYGEDFPHIRDEDESLLNELEDLLVEFVDEFNSQGYPLLEFLDGYWNDRVSQIKKEKESRRLTQEEMVAIEGLGVRLIEQDSEDSEGSEISETSENEERFLSGVMDEFTRRLDEIHKPLP